ncbi:hypothetical protein LLOABG_LLOABG_14830, partial [Dysosmobacter welbionis]
CTYLWEWPNTTASTPARSAGTSFLLWTMKKVTPPRVTVRSCGMASA